MHDIIIKKTSYDYSITDLNNDDVDMSQSICGVFHWIRVQFVMDTQQHFQCCVTIII